MKLSVDIFWNCAILFPVSERKKEKIMSKKQYRVGAKRFYLADFPQHKALENALVEGKKTNQTVFVMDNDNWKNFKPVEVFPPLTPQGKPMTPHQSGKAAASFNSKKWHLRVDIYEKISYTFSSYER